MLLYAEHLSINFGSRELLDDVNFYLNEGDKVGVIGINGTGKSTFLNVLSGRLAPDAGRVSRDPNVQVSSLSQNPVMNDEDSVLEYVLASCPPEYRALSDYEAKTMLNHLGIPDHSQKVGTLSGGQRKRAALAAALIQPADVLILDEPTNHLDSEMTIWLEESLRKFRGGIVMVTHDRYFLERACNHITEVSRGKLYHYEANYSKYLELKTEREEMAQASERKRQSILRVEREWIMRGCRARSTKSRERIERYEDLRDQDGPETDETLGQITASASRLGKKIIDMDHVCKSFDGRPIISDFSYHVVRDDRIGITGINGAGKSTLLHMLSGELAPDSGTVEIGTTVRIGHFSQEGRELDLNQRIFDFIHEISSEVKTREGTISAKTMMERFLFPSSTHSKLIGELSGGERRRLYLLSILISAPNVLLLDEPTNDLDIMTLSILEDYLDTFPGPVIVVSHDRFLLDKLTNQIFEVRNGQVTRYSGNWSDWQRKKAAEENAGAGASGGAGSKGRENAASGAGSKGRENTAGAGSADAARPKSSRDTWHQGTKKLRFTYKEQKEFETIDDDIAALEQQIEECEQAQNECASDFVRLQELQEKKEQLEASLEEKTERWFYLQELKERIDAQ